MNVIDSIAAHAPTMAALRRDIHAHPELCFEEVRTADLVVKKLADWGIPVHRGLGTTGVVGIVHGRDGGACGRGIGLRADMDALPMQEFNTFAHASQHAGKMHACGHDGHTAMLLSAARHLAATRHFDGIVHAVFQPAEEGLGGARKMLEDGFLDLFPCDAMFGMHNGPGIPEGQFMAVPGCAMASADTCIITIQGVGGHAAFPHNAVDPILVGSALVMALQSIVSRNVPPLQTGIISLGAFLAGDAPNVIPGSAELRLSVRAMQPEIRDLLERRIHEIANAVAQTYGATADVNYMRRYPVLMNDPTQTAFCLDLVRDWLGETGVVPHPEPVPASEDFAFFLEKVPGCFINIGNGVGSVGGCMVHNAGYDFNDRILSTGATYWVKLVERWLAKV